MREIEKIFFNTTHITRDGIKTWYENYKTVGLSLRTFIIDTILLTLPVTQTLYRKLIWLRLRKHELKKKNKKSMNKNT